MALSAHIQSLPRIRWPGDRPRPAYDVVIVGGGGHGLSTAWHLATQHRITNVAVLEGDYIASGNTGRNTTIIRSNYALPEAVRFYDHSLRKYERFGDEVGADIVHQTKGHIWLAHTEMALRTERARSLMNLAMGVETVMVTPVEIKELVPQIDLTGGGRYPILGASFHKPAATARHDRVAWAYAAGASQAGVDIHQHTPVDRLVVDGGRVTGVRLADGSTIARRTGAERHGRPGHGARGDRRGAPADPHASPPCLRHQ